MKNTIKLCKDLVKHKKVKLVSKNNYGYTYEVEDQLVRVYSRQGAKLMSCTCENHVRNCNSSSWCYHKLSVIIYESENGFLEQLDKLIELYKNWKNIKIPVKIEVMISDLENLRSLR